MTFWLRDQHFVTRSGKCCMKISYFWKVFFFTIRATAKNQLENSV